MLLNLTNSQEPEPLEEKKIPGAGAGAAWEKNQEPEPLKKLPTPQPWML